MVKPLNIFLPELLAWLSWSLVCSMRWLNTTKCVQMVTLGWPWPIFHKGEIGPLDLWMEERWTLYFFFLQNNGTLWYVRRCFMHLCEYQRPRSFSDHGQRSLGLNVLKFSNDFSFENARPISIKFYIQHSGNGRLRICSNGPWSHVKDGHNVHIW